MSTYEDRYNSGKKTTPERLAEGCVIFCCVSIGIVLPVLMVLRDLLAK
jgi:hypothetical protein